MRKVKQQYKKIETLLLLCDFYQIRDIDLLQIRYVTTLCTSLHTSFKLRKVQLCSQLTIQNITHTYICIYTYPYIHFFPNC